MSFSIFAAGSCDFHYKKDDCIEGDDFDVVKILAILQSMQPTAAGAAGAAGEIVIDQTFPDITDAMGAVALFEFLHLLKTSVDLLAMNSGSNGGWISVASTETHLLWPDTVRFNSYKFKPGNDPGTEFVKTIGPGLKETDLNNWGVLRALVLVMNKFADKYDNSMKLMLNISLSH